MALASRALDTLRNYVGSVTWGPLVDLSRASVQSILRRIEVGNLVITDVSGTVTTYGRRDVAAGSGPDAMVRVRKDAFWVRLFLFADMVGAPVP